jgi:hypothetical protein
MAKCPLCGGDAYLVGPSNNNYPAAFRCYRHGEYSFSETHVGLTAADKAQMRKEDSDSVAASRANAGRLRND